MKNVDVEGTVDQKSEDKKIGLQGTVEQDYNEKLDLGCYKKMGFEQMVDQDWTKKQNLNERQIRNLRTKRQGWRERQNRIIMKKLDLGCYKKMGFEQTVDQDLTKEQNLNKRQNRIRQKDGY